MTITIQFNEQEQAIFKSIAQRQQLLQTELNVASSMIVASKGHAMPAKGVQISQDITSIIFEVEDKKEDE